MDRSYRFRVKASDLARVRARYAQPVVRDGVTYVPIKRIVEELHLSLHTLHAQAAEFKGIEQVLTTRKGWRFIRVPRHNGDEKPLVYVDPNSFKQGE